MNARETYRVFSLFYDDYTKGFDSDVPVYREFVKDRSNVLEIGCGTGRILRELARPGKKLTGVDVSGEMLARARVKLGKEIVAGSVELLEHDFTDGPAPGLYDAALVTWYTFNYVIEEPSAFLKNVFLSLEPGSPILFDLFCPRSFAESGTDGVWTRKEISGENGTYLLLDRRTVRNGIEERIQTITLDGETHTVTTNRKYYSRRDMASFLREAGFSRVRFMNNYDISTLRPPDPEEPAPGEFMCVAEKAQSD